MTSDSHEHPLLTIVLPTYNRASVLEKSLPWMRSQTERFGDKVEVVVSNNHSTDDTASVIERQSDWAQARMVKPRQHVPPHEHFLWLGTEMPRAEYCWMLGDDDFPLADGIARVLAAISEPEPAGFIMLNVAVLSLDDWLAMSSGRTEIRMNELTVSRITPENADHRCARLHELLELGGGDIFIACGVPAHIFKPKLWAECMQELNLMHLSNAGRFTNLNNTFPHLAILYACEGRCSFQFIHEACAVQSHGAQEWAADQLKLLTNSYPYIVEQYHRLGVSENYMRLTSDHYLVHQWKTVFKLASKDFRLHVVSECLGIMRRSHPGLAGAWRIAKTGIPPLMRHAYGMLPDNLKNCWRKLKRQ